MAPLPWVHCLALGSCAEQAVSAASTFLHFVQTHPLLGSALWFWLLLPGWGKIKMGFLPGTGSILSLLEDAFCCVLDFSGGFWALNSSQLPPLCAKLLLDFWGVFHSPAAAGSCSVLFHVLTQAGLLITRARVAQTWKIYWNTTSPRLVVGLGDSPEHCPATQQVLSPFL